MSNTQSNYVYEKYKKYMIKYLDSIEEPFLNNSTIGYGNGIENESFIIIPNESKGNILKILCPTQNIYDNKELQDDLINKIEQNGYTLTPTELKYIKKNYETVMFEGSSKLNICDNNPTMFEITTKNYQKSIDELVTELIENKDMLINLLKKSTNKQLRFYNGEYYELLEGDGQNYDYIGSYHFNMTLPHIRDKNIENMKCIYTGNRTNLGIFDVEFFQKHKNFAIALQYFEPLLLGVYGLPDVTSFTTENKSLASFRIFNSASVFINSTSLKQLNFVSNSRNIEGLSAENFINKTDFQNLKQNIFNYTTNIKRIVNYPNFATNNIGTDIRTSKSDPEKVKKDCFGFELRISDNFNIEFVTEYFKFLLLIAYYIEFNNIDLINNNIDPYFDQSIHKIINNIISSGWASKIDNDYVLMINSVYKFNMPVQIYTCYEYLNKVNEIVCGYYSTHTSNNLHLFEKKLFDAYHKIIGNVIPNIGCPNRDYASKILIKLIEKHPDIKEWILSIKTQQTNQSQQIKSLINDNLNIFKHSNKETIELNIHHILQIIN